jgi:hypothetical protein
MEMSDSRSRQFTNRAGEQTMSAAVRLATNYGKICRRGAATILLSKHINCIAIDKLLVGMEIYFKFKNGKRFYNF